MAHHIGRVKRPRDHRRVGRFVAGRRRRRRGGSRRDVGRQARRTAGRSGRGLRCDGVWISRKRATKCSTFTNLVMRSDVCFELDSLLDLGFVRAFARAAHFFCCHSGSHRSEVPSDWRVALPRVALSCGAQKHCACFETRHSACGVAVSCGARACVMPIASTGETAPTRATASYDVPYRTTCTHGHAVGAESYVRSYGLTYTYC